MAIISTESNQIVFRIGTATGSNARFLVSIAAGKVVGNWTELGMRIGGVFQSILIPDHRLQLKFDSL